MQLDQRANFYLINKPINYTSQDVCAVIKKKYNYKKVGHSGTLDPLATGLLIVATNAYTKLLPYITKYDKTYIVQAIFGHHSESGDMGTKIDKVEDYFVKDTIDQINKGIKTFVGSIVQIPSKYSAIKVKGKRLYKYARENKEVNIPSRKVEIKKFELNRIIDINTVEFHVDCSSGTYIRTLIEDLAKSIGTNAVVKSLNRIKVGDIHVDLSLNIESLPEKKEIEKYSHAYYDILSIPTITANHEMLTKIQNGGFINSSEFNCKEEHLIVYEDKVIAVYTIFNEKFFKPVKVLI
jgi:tRNA pseudouridine55 synthase